MRDTAVGGTRSWALRALVIACLLALMLLSAGPASAHATLVRTDPGEGAVLDSSPGELTFTFDEPVRALPGSARFFDADGNELSASATVRDSTLAVQVAARLKRGSYVLVWRVTSADGHPVSGSLTFSVGEPSLSIAPPKVAAPDTGTGRVPVSIVQALVYLGLLASVGLLVFGWWCLRSVQVDRSHLDRLARIRRWSTGLALIAGMLLVPCTSAYQTGGSLLDVWRGWDWGLVADDVVVLALMSVGLLGSHLLVRRPVPWALGSAAVALMSPVVVGHTRTVAPTSLMQLADLAHLVAGAIWLGGLLGLAVVLGAFRGRPHRAMLVLSRFSTIGALVLLAVAATGVLMAWRILDGWAPLWQTGYGRVLLLKIGLVALVAALAGANRFLLLPRTRAALGHDAGRRRVTSVRRTVALEAIGLVVVVALTGFLVNLSPRPAPLIREPVASRVQTAVVGETKVLVTMTPAYRGRNVITVQLQDRTGEPRTGYAAPQLGLGSGDLDLGTVPVSAVDEGTYRAEAMIPRAGVWQVRVSVRLSEFDNPVAIVEIPVT